MLIQPKIRGFICTTAHPTGCKQVVLDQINYVKSKGTFKGPQNVLIIGASTGYGLASRIVATFGTDAKTIGVFYEKGAEDKRTASAGWYNTAAFEEIAHKENHYAKSINGDAFSKDIKQRTAALIKQDLKKIDLIIYSLASPRRVHPETGEVYSSVLKPIGQTYTSKTVDAFRKEIKDVTLETATHEEIDNTIAVMGGEDWEMWIDFLSSENLLSDHATTVAYSYIGPELTFPIYKDGSIGAAKEHLRLTAEKLNQKLNADRQGRALLSVNKALVTQASSAIPVVPLYISLLYKLMKENGTHEGCIEQMYRLFKDHLYASDLNTDALGQVRLDDLEMKPEIQQEISRLWPQITSDNVNQLTDIRGYCDDFYRLFGFGAKDVDYTQDVNPDVKIASIAEQQTAE